MVILVAVAAIRTVQETKQDTWSGILATEGTGASATAPNKNGILHGVAYGSGVFMRWAVQKAILDIQRSGKQLDNVPQRHRVPQ
jgi:hypothetical protein